MAAARSAPGSALPAAAVTRIKQLVSVVDDVAASPAPSGGAVLSAATADAVESALANLVAAVEGSPAHVGTVARVTQVDAAVARLLRRVAPSYGTAAAPACSHALHLMVAMCPSEVATTHPYVADSGALKPLATVLAGFPMSPALESFTIAQAACTLVARLAAGGRTDSVLAEDALLSGLSHVLTVCRRLIASGGGGDHADALASLTDTVCSTVCALSCDTGANQDALCEAGVAASVGRLLDVVLVAGGGDHDDEGGDTGVARSVSLLRFAPRVFTTCVSLVSGGNRAAQAVLVVDGDGGVDVSAGSTLAMLVEAVGRLWLWQATVLALGYLPPSLGNVQADLQDAFLCAQLLLTELQAGNEDVAGAVETLVAAREQASWIEATMVTAGIPLDVPLDSHVPPARDLCHKISSILHACLWELTHNHYDDDACVEALRQLLNVLEHPVTSVIAKHTLLHRHSGVALVVRCLNNIDEAVMVHAARCTYALLLDCPAAQDKFLSHGGLAALSGCMHDYNVDIRVTALRCVALLASERSSCRDEVRASGLLGFVTHLVAEFPADDITINVVHAAVTVLCHAVTGNRANQQFVREVAGAEALGRLLMKCSSAYAQYQRGGGGGDGAGGKTGDGEGDEAGAKAGDGGSPAASDGVASAVSAGAGGSAGAGAGSTPTDDGERPRSAAGTDASSRATEAGAELLEHRPDKASELIEITALTLSNLAYRCHENQVQLAADGALRLVVRLVWQHFVGAVGSRRSVLASSAPFRVADTDDGVAIAAPLSSVQVPEGLESPPPKRPSRRRASPSRKRNPRVEAEKLLSEVLAAEPGGDEPLELLLPSQAHDVAASLIMVLVNTCDSQPAVQAALDCSLVESLLKRVLPRATERYATRGDRAAAGSAALLLSHIVMNHSASQLRYTNAELVQTLLDSLAVGARRSASGSRSPRKARHGTDSDASGAGDGAGAGAARGSEDGSGGAGGEESGEDPTARDGLRYVEGALDPGASAPSGAQLRDEGTTARATPLVCLYSLMALNNLTYNNPDAQSLIVERGGVERVLRCLDNPSYDIRMSAAFCVGNLVKGNPEAAAQVADSGGVVALMNLLNDVDDDELSKKAFAALTHMEHVAVHAVLESMDACAARIKHVTPAGVPADAVATIVRACRTPAAAKAGEGDDLAVLHAWLERCLPVLNGLLYTSSKARAWLSSNAGWRSGLAPLLRVYVLDVPANVRVFAAFVMTNLSIARDAALQDTAGTLKAFDVLVPFLGELQLPHAREREPASSGAGDDSAAAAAARAAAQVELREARGMVYSLMVQLADHHTANLCTLARATPLLERLLPTDCVGTAAIGDATELLLALAESPEACTQAAATAPGAVESLLQEVAGGGAVGGNTVTLTARAAQCLTELRGQPGHGVALDYAATSRPHHK